MTNYLEFLNPNRIWSLGTHGQLQYVNISGDLSVNNITTSDISINNLLKATSALIDTALFKNITISDTILSSNLEVSNNLLVKGDASFNADIQISGNIISSSNSKGLDGQFLRATISGWDWQYLDASYVSDTSFNILQELVNTIDASYVIDTSFNILQELVNTIDASYISDTSFNILQELVNTIDASYVSDTSFVALQELVNTIDASYVSDTSFNILQELVNTIDASYVSDTSFNIAINRIDICLNKLNSIDISLQNQDISLTQLIEDVRDICGSIFLEKIRNISGDVVNIESNLTNISGDLFNLINTVNNLDISYLTDVSFIELVNIVNNLDSSYVTDICFNDYKTIVDTSFSLLKQSLNDLSSVVDNSFTSLNNNLFDLSNEFKNFVNNVDNSFNIFEISLNNNSINISNISNNLLSLDNKLDNCFNVLNNDISNLSNVLNNFSVNIDNSFNITNQNISDVSTSLNITNQNISDVSTSLNITNQNISDVSTFLNITNQNISDVSTSLNITNQNISDVSTSLNITNQNISDVSTSLNITNQNISDVSTSLNITNQNINNLINNIDNSFSFVYQDISNINNLLNNLDASFVTDDSFNTLKSIVDNLNTETEIDYVNDVSQTFYEIMTQQPYTFDSSGIPDDVNSALINVSWNYDKIMAKNNNNNYVNLVHFDENKQSLLPFINTIQIDISGLAFTMNSGWRDLSTLTITSNESYNVNKYKEFILRKFLETPDSTNITGAILSTLDPFDIRIYGINNGINDPTIENRALYFRGISFEPASAPTRPIFVSENILSTTSFTSTFNVAQIEKNYAGSIGILKNYIVDYSANDSLASIIYPINTIDLSDSNDFVNNYANASNFNFDLTNLLPGTKYNYKVKVINNLNISVYSDYSIDRISNYNFIPNSNSINTSIDTYIKQNTVNISNPNFNNGNIIYINLGDANDIIDYNNISIQTIEISHPYYANQENTNYGFGKYIDNINSLVSINVSIDNVLKQSITFDGSFINTEANESKHNGNTYNFISLPNNSLQDIYINDVTNQGFRLKGSFKLETIANNDIITAIGSASTNPYNIKFDYLRDASINGVNSSNTYEVYIDNLTNSPSIGFDYNAIEVLSVLYNMGIPSIESFKLIFERTYYTINSQYLYIAATDNNKIASINVITNTSASAIQNITLNNSNIVASGNYSFLYNNIQTLTSNYYTNINYTSRIHIDNSNLNWTESVYNLYNIVTTNVELNTNHYCDYNSFNKSNSKIVGSKLDLTYINVYEIDNISSLGTTINGLNIVHYTNHNNVIKDHTLMYVDGLFQGNSSVNYPNISSYSYNPVNITNNYSAGNISYDLSGNNTGANNNGYKFIVFKINKNPNNAASNGSYIFNNNVYNVLTNNDGYKYLSIKSLLTNFFSVNTLNNLFDKNNNDAIGFVRVSLVGNNFKRIGNLKQSFNPVGGIWNQNGGTDTNYNNTLTKAYGTKVEYSSNNDFGIYIDYSALNDDLTLFIGLKN